MKSQCPTCRIPLKMYHLNFIEAVFMCKKCTFPLDSEFLDDFLITLPQPIIQQQQDKQHNQQQPPHQFVDIDRVPIIQNPIIHTNLKENNIHNNNNNNDVVQEIHVSSLPKSGSVPDLETFLLDTGQPSSHLPSELDMNVKHVAKQLMEGYFNLIHLLLIHNLLFLFNPLFLLFFILYLQSFLYY